MRTFTQLFILLFILLALPAGAQEISLDDDFSSGFSWFRGAGIWGVREQKLIQTNAGENMAIASRAAVQKGYLVYSFDMSIQEGLEDGYGGVGIHILADTPVRGRSWGQGQSVLLWLTYDVYAYGGGSFFGQIYHSSNDSVMDMIHKGDLYPLHLATDPGESPKSLTGKKMTIRIAIDTATGNGIFYDPFRAGKEYRFNIKKKNMTGKYISFRTNSLGVNIDNVRVMSLPE